MFRKQIFILLALCGSMQVFAQTDVSGIVSDSSSGRTLADATVSLVNAKGNSVAFTLSNTDGSFRLSRVSSGSYKLMVSYIGYKTWAREIQLPANGIILRIHLAPLSVISDEVIVSGIRAQEHSAGAFTNIGKKELNESNFGQDFPMLLNMTPSVVTTSDAGAGVGYTGISIRGVDQTRINVTINGIPVNDPESQGTYWVDLPDFASSVQNVQIQRGVGTSTNGAAAFGSSINVQTNGPRHDAYTELNNSTGSYNTFKHNVQFGTGLLKNGWNFDGRLSKISSDGYMDRAFSDLKSYYLSAAHYGKKSIFKLVQFSGKEQTYQAWNGVPQNVLDTNRTYNEFTYKNQTDNYQQDYYQAFYTYNFSKKLLLNTALFYTKGKGYYEEYKAGESLSSYNLTNVIVGNDTITQSDLVRRRWLDNDFYGTTFSLNYNPAPNTACILGGGATYFDNRHFGEVIWAQYAATAPINTVYYKDRAFKTDVNMYGKVNHRMGKLSLFADLQMRHIDYSFLGYDQNLNNVQQQATFNFFNPKGGVVYTLRDSSDLYFSYSIANREPNRDDFVNSSPASRPKAESMQDMELGWRKKWKQASFTINAYYMNYHNQLILTGKINDVGSYIRTNVPQSYRSGVELSGSVNITRKLQWSGNVTWSRNKIKKFTEYIDDYDWGGQWSQVHKNTDLVLSPNLIAASQFRILPFKNVTLDLMSKYVARQYLDNTQHDERSLDPFFVNNIRLSYSCGSWAWFRYSTIGVMINNVLDEKYEANGYTYSGISGGVRSDYNYYYPQAGRNFMAQLTLGF